MSYYEAPTTYLERVAELKSKRLKWEKELLEKVSQELREEGLYDNNRRLEKSELDSLPLPSKRKVTLEEFALFNPTDVALWIENINPDVMRGHRHKFVRAKITGRKLLQYHDHNLKEAGIGSRSQRKLILKHITRMREYTKKQQAKRKKFEEKIKQKQQEAKVEENAAKMRELEEKIKEKEQKEKEAKEKARREHKQLLKYGRMRAPPTKSKRKRSRSKSPSPPRSSKRQRTRHDSDDSDEESSSGFSC